MFPGFGPGFFDPSTGAEPIGSVGPWHSKNGWKPPSDKCQWLGNAPWVYSFMTIWTTMHQLGIPFALLDRRGLSLNAWVWGTGPMDNLTLHVTDENGGVLYEGAPVNAWAPQLIPHVD